MQCGKCEQENPLGSNFCLGCGARLGLACASCGTELPAGSRFCNRCGTPVQAETGVSRFAGGLHPQAFGREDPHVQGALEGERKQVTVLFADLKGSMELLADRDPEEARLDLEMVADHARAAPLYERQGLLIKRSRRVRHLRCQAPPAS